MLSEDQPATAATTITLSNKCWPPCSLFEVRAATLLVPLNSLHVQCICLYPRRHCLAFIYFILVTYWICLSVLRVATSSRSQTGSSCSGSASGPKFVILPCPLQWQTIEEDGQRVGGGLRWPFASGDWLRNTTSGPVIQSTPTHRPLKRRCLSLSAFFSAQTCAEFARQGAGKTVVGSRMSGASERTTGVFIKIWALEQLV